MSGGDQCYDFEASGQCRFGLDCRFVHSTTAADRFGVTAADFENQPSHRSGGFSGGFSGGGQQRNQREEPCYDWDATGSCRFANDCKFKHSASSAGTGGHNAPQGSSDTVFVGNLPYSVRWQELKDHMRQAGDVVKADVLESFDGRSKGSGIVRFARPSDAQNAIASLNDTVIAGTDRPIFVREDRGGPPPRSDGGAPPHRGRDRSPFNSRSQYRERSPPRGGRVQRDIIPDTQLYVGNLPWSIRWQDLKDKFKEVGNVEFADVIMERDNPRRSKGFGVVRFHTPEEAKAAIEAFDKTDWEARTIEVRVDERAGQF